MKSNLSGPVFNSIFTKLILIFVVSAFCVTFLLRNFNRYLFQNTEDFSLRKSVVHYLTYVIRDLGNPPDPERAKQIAQASSIKISFHSPGLSWSAPGMTPPPPNQIFRRWSEFPNVRSGRGPGCIFVEWDSGSGIYIFEFSPAFTRRFGNTEPLVILTSLLLITLLVTYFSIRSVLFPVKALATGVGEVGRGNLDYLVSVKRKDELGRLAIAFNAMTKRIRTMLRAKEQLLLDVSHELRSPITRIKLSLRSVPASLAKVRIEEDVHEMERMITQALDASRESFMPEQLDLKPTDIVDLINDVIRIYKKEGREINWEEVPEKTELQIDPGRIRRVFMNILDNAFKFSDPRSPLVRISLERHPENIVIRIRDCGIGIPSDEIPLVFEPFYRVDKSRSQGTGGYGLGLSLCKSVMEAHRGKIEIESALNQGTTVMLTFRIFPDGAFSGSA